MSATEIAKLIDIESYPDTIFTASGYPMVKSIAEGVLRNLPFFAAMPLMGDLLEPLIIRTINKALGPTYVSVRTQNKLLAVEVKERNINVYLGLLDLKQEIIGAIESQSNLSPSEKILTDRLEKLQKSIDQFQELYKASNGNKFERYGKQRKNKYIESDLANMYVDCTIRCSIERPNQSELEKFTQISQSTWSRIFKLKSFWAAVIEISNDRIDKALKRKDQLIDTKRNAESYYDALESKIFKFRHSTASQGEDGSPVIVEKRKNLLNDNPEEEEVVEKVHQLLEIDRLSKHELISLLSGECALEKNELELLTVKNLRKIYALIIR